ncbi:MAG TPA: helix-turn-helix domain-containing protein [Actinoplanes sp.]|nr:helix-turn-helix domain-containing protein [Actinoplanes sp.]
MDQLTDSASGLIPEETLAQGDSAVTDLDLGALLRALRRSADLSQRELALGSGVPQSTVARIETGAVTNPSFRTVERLVRAAGHQLRAGRPGTGRPGAAQPSAVPHEQLRDRGDRRYPAHLDVTEVTSPEQWWGSWWTSSLIRSLWPLGEVPSVTFDLSRRRRDERRTRADRAASVRIRQVPLGRAADAAGEVSLGSVGFGSWGAVPGCWMWVAEAPDGARVGQLSACRATAQARPSPPPIPERVRPRPAAAGPSHAGLVLLNHVLVAPDWRRLGVGRRLVGALRDSVGEPLAALALDHVAERFLEGCGYAVIRRERATWYAAA